jgi:two-component system nitrogen regulation response regulator NtrX
MAALGLSHDLPGRVDLAIALRPGARSPAQLSAASRLGTGFSSKFLSTALNQIGIPVDVRVITATHHDLERAITEKRFRQDLYYRLNGFTIKVPPLRDRGNDIALLLAHSLRRFAAELGKDVHAMSPDAMELLLRYPWPGNVRELRNLVERLVIVCPQTRIEPHHLPPELFRGVAESPQQPYSTLHEARSAYEREFILRKLQEHRWNMTQTATALGLERSHLYRKMKSLGIAAPE